MATNRFILCLLILLIPACGPHHVTFDTLHVEHAIALDPNALVNYCETVCAGDRVCFEDCARRFMELLSDPDVCAELKACIR